MSRKSHGMYEVHYTYESVPDGHPGKPQQWWWVCGRPYRYLSEAETMARKVLVMPAPDYGVVTRIVRIVRVVRTHRQSVKALLARSARKLLVAER